MNLISTRTHGMLDYIMGVLLLLAPFIFGFADGGPAMWVPIVLGAGVILYSLFTAYELGLVGAISMRGHLVLDFVGGVILAASPWLFGFAIFVWAPHLILGLAEIGAALTTQRTPQHRPGDRHTPTPHHP